jgi:hypothetical protein
VHVEDLAELYELVLIEILSKGGDSLPKGKQGVVFSAHGRHTWMEVSQAVADAAFEAGLIKSKAVRSISLAEGAKLLTGGVEQIAELGFASTCRTRSEMARKLGWRPRAGVETWQRGFVEEVSALSKL